MLVAGFDLETEWLTPVDAKQCKIWESAVVIWDTKTNQPVTFIHDLIWTPTHIYDPRMKISLEYLEEFGVWPLGALDRIQKAFKNVDAIVAHNGKDFDKIVLEEEFKRHGFDPMSEKLWIDTTVDINYPENIDTRKLEFLAPCHGFINPFAHRALFDVCTMLRIAGQYDWNTIFDRARTKDIYVVADVKKPWEDNGRSVDKAKSRGYRFDKEAKFWYKKIKENELESEKAKAEFRVGLWNAKNKEETK